MLSGADSTATSRDANRLEVRARDRDVRRVTLRCDDEPVEGRASGERFAATGVDVQRAARGGECVANQLCVSPRCLRVVAPATEPREIPTAEGRGHGFFDQVVQVGHDDRASTLRTSVGEPGAPPIADGYSGTPTQVSMRPSTRSPTVRSSRESAKVMPEAAAPSA